MNKIFRIVWSRATQSWVAVSELTKAHKKQSSSNAQKSAVKFSGNFIKSSAIALTLLSGHSAYAADAASGLIQINSTGTATASGSESIAVGKDSKATSDTAVAIGKDAEASGKQSVALGNKAKATGENSYAIGWGSNASHPRSISIGYNSAARHNNSLALGYNTIASGPSSVALGAGSNALGDDSYAIGYGSKTNTGANFAMAFGNSSKANKANDIAFGKEAETRDQGQGHSIAIGYGAMSGTNNAGKNLNGGDAGGVAIGTGAYTGVNQTDGRSVNSSVAVGAGAGAGFRKLDNNGMPVQNATDVDNNDEVLKKAFGVKNVADYQKIAGGTNGYTNVNINEGTALGRNARAIGDQSVAIGAQTIAGMGAIALGGNDITQFANKKYYKSTKENFAVTDTIDHNQDAEISDKTISATYNDLVGTKLDTAYKATYAQDGSVVLGAQAHSGTPLGTALGTNALVRKGAFGATAIGAGSQVQANAEAAVAIGMGSFADGKYAVAAGTASLAKEGDVAIGYKAKATGKEGALAIGLGTNAQGDSSIMIGGADVKSASKQNTSFDKATNSIISKDVTERINGQNIVRHYSFAGTTPTTGTIAEAFKELTGREMTVKSIDFSSAKNKNGHASTSLGVHSLAKGDLATAIGASARADVIGSLALGTGAHATLQNAVAIGTGSTTELLGTRQLSVNYDSDGNIVSDGSKDIAYTFKWAGGINTSEGDVVSFGSSGAERQLKNVAAGRVAEDSTDAINGSQLNSITKKIAAGFNTSGNVVTGSSGEFTSKKANTNSTDKDYETAIRSQDKVQLQVGNNLKLDRDETEVEIEVQDDFDKTKTVKKKVKKADFAYSLNPVLTNLTSAEFKADGKPTVNISSDGITITPAAPTTGGKQKPNVSLTENGLNNGGNAITNVAGNLNGAKKDTTAPTTKADKPNNVDDIKNNAATVGDVLNAGWNLQEKGAEKDFVTAYDTVNFIDGEGTSVSVENTDNKTSKIKYSVNLGDGLEKDAMTNKIKAKAGNGVTVGADGINVNTGKGLKIDADDDNKVAVDTDGTTITVGTDGKVKAVTGSTETVTDTNKGTDEKAGQVRPVKADKGKLATVDAVANAVNNAAWSITSGTDGGSFATSGHTQTTEKISAGGSVTFKAGNNLIIKQAGTDFTYSLNPILNGLTSAEFKGTGENAPITKLTNAGITVTTPADAVANTPEKTVTLNQDGLNNGGNAISNVKSNLPATKNSDTANTAAAPSNATKTQAVPNTTNMKGTDYVNPNNAATVGDVLNAGWNLKGKGTAVDFVKAYDTVDFVDGDGTTASVESKDGQTSTVKYSVNTTTIKADTTNAGKVKAEGTGNTFATAETVASAINEAYWKAAASGNGVTADVADNVKAGDTVTFKAGKNLTVTHNNTNKSFEFATTDTPEFSSVQFGNNGPKITHDGNTIKVSGANGTDSVKITNVADGKDDNDAVNVSQLKASGWNIAGNGKTKVDTINKDDQVNFLNGSGTTVTVEKDKGANGKETGNVNVKYDVNVGNGLQKDTASNTISVKPADKSLEVTNGGVKVKAADNTLTTDANGLKVNTGNITASSVPTVADADKDKIATVGNVAEAIKAAAWKATSDATTNGENSGKKEQEVKAGDTVTFEADKNIKITQDAGKFTFATKDNVTFTTVQVGGNQGPKLSKTDDGDLKISGPNGTAPVKVTNVKDGDISADSKDAINGSQFNAVANNNIKLGGDNESETDGQSLNKAGGMKFNINGADGIETAASGDSVTVKINAETKAKIDSVDDKADKNLSNITSDGETKIKNLVTWKAKASNSGNELAEGDKTADSDTDAQQVGADGVLTLDAGKNLLLKRWEKTFTYALSKTLSDLTSAEFKKGDVTTKIDGDGLTIQAPTPAGGTAPKAITVNKDGISAGDKAITDVNSGLTNYGGTDAKKDLINLGNSSTGSKVSDNNAATVGDLRNMGWIVSSDKSTGENGAVTTDAYSATVKNADEVKFVGTHAAKVSGKTVNGVRTITVDVEVPDAKTAKLVSSKDGSVIAPSTDSKLQDALKTAKDELAALPNTATEAEKEAAKNKVKAAETALNDAVDNKGVATAKNVADMINNSGFTLKTSKAEGGEKDTKSTGDEVINPGKAVEMIAGKNLTVKQEANGKVTYSLNPELTNLTSAEFKGTGKNAPTTKLTNDGVTITPKTAGKNLVSLTQNGLNNGGNAITNVAGNLDGAKTGTTAPTTSATKPTLGTAANEVNSNNAATVGDVLNAGWNLQGNNTAKDFVTAYDTVNFIDGDGTTVSVENTDNKTSKIKYSVNLGDGLEKDATTNKIKVKAADKSLEVTNGGVKVKTADNTLTTDANGLKVNTGNITASSVPTVADADKNKIATVGNVADAIKAAAWKATSAATTNGENSGKKEQEVKAGDTVTFEADKNIKIAQTDGKFTFSTKDDVEFNSVQLGGNKGPKLTKTDGNDLKVSGSNGTDPVKITNVADGNISADSKDAINGSQFNAVANNNIKLGGDNKSETNGQSLNKAGGMKFNINGANGIETEASGDSVTVKINAETKAKIDSVDDKADKNLSNITADGETKIKNLVTWKAKASNSGKELAEGDKTADSDTDAQQVGADGVLTLDAGKNLLLKRSEKTFTYALSKTLSDLTSAEFKKGDVTTKINGDGLTIQAPTPAGGTAPKAITVNKDGISAGDKAITDVNSGLTNYGGTDAKKDLINLGNSSAGSKVSDNNAATVGDLRNMGWVVSSNKTTGANGTVTTDAYSATVKNANEVKFIGEGTAIVSGKTDDKGVRRITVKVDNQTSTNKSVTPVSYTKKDGTKVYPKEVDNGDGTKSVKFYPNPDGSGTEIPPSEVITSVNGPKGTKTPTTLSNVEGNLDGAKTNTTAPTTSHAGVDTKNPTANNYVNTHNAATVGDVLQAGWNLQNNGTAKDFVKPYDTVNFVNGINTTAVVTTSDDGTTSNVTYNVTGLPVTYTTADGTPVSKIGDKYYKVNDKGQPVDENGKPSTKVDANGQPLDENGVVIQPIDTTTNPLTSKLVNPNVTNTTTEPNKKTTDPTQLGNVTSGLQKYGDTVDGKEVPGSTKANNGLIDLSTPTDGFKPKVSDNTAATVGDLRNMGWIVSSDKTTGETDKAYTDTVKNANEVKFVGAGTAIVSGKTVDGVRTITVKVDDQVSTNNSVTPVNYTKADGTKVYPKMVTNPDTGKGELKFFEKPDGSGAEVPKGDVITSINGPEGTTSPTTLKNVKNNIPNVNDGSKTITAPDGKEKAGDVENINKAPLTAEEAAALANPKTKDGQANPKYIGNNAATVSDVLNAGWNLQNNGAAKDFVKPFDTVNFRDGGNTTVSVTTDDNLTSHVQVNVTGLPVSNTITDPTTGKQVPVVKVGDVFYRANPDGTPNIERDTAGNPTNGYVRANDGKLYPRDAVEVTPNAADPTQPPTITPKAGAIPNTVNTNLVNPNVANTKDNPGNSVNTPSQLGNVANGAKTFAPVAADGTKLVQVGDKFYPADKVENGVLKPGATKADAKEPVKLANDGKWYPADQVEANGKPKGNATPIAGVPNNIGKSGLVDFSNSNPNNAATVGDLQNMGWVVSAEGNSYSDQVRNANEVKFVGKNGIQVSGKTDDKGVRTLTFEMEAGEVTPTEITKADGTKLVKVGDKAYKPEDIGTDGQPKQGKDPVGTVAKDGNVYATDSVIDSNGNVYPAGTTLTNGAAPAGTAAATPIATNKPNNGSKFVTGNQVADAIEKSGFVVGKNNKALSASDFKNEDEKVNPNDELRFADGDNTNVKLATREVLDASGKVKTVTTVKVDVVDLPVKYTDADGNIVKKGEDGKYYDPKDLEGKVYDPTTKTYKNADGALAEQPKAKENIQANLVNPNVSNTDTEPNKQTITPTQLGNVASGTKTIQLAVGTTVKDKDNKELTLANDGKWYEKGKVGTDGKPVVGATPLTPVNPDKAGLADLDNSKSTNALSVEDAKKLGWVVGTPDNNYNDQVRNANKVDFKGGNGIEVTGKTTADGIREITVGIKEGTVTNNVKVTKEDGTVIEAIRDKDGKLYEKDVNGKVDKTKPVETTNKDKVENNGSGFVTGNTVATAIQESGWNVGLADSSKANEAFNDDSKALSADKLEKVNPDDNVRFADGKNTKVQAATMDEVNKDGKKITNTYVRFNVDLPISQITSKDKDGNKVAKAADGKWHLVKSDGTLDTTKEVEPSNVRTSASMDPDGLGDKYTSTSRKEDLTPIQLAELTGKQEAAAKAAEEKIKDLLKGQSKDVIEAASKAAADAAKEEAKVQYLKDKGLDKGTGGTVISNVAWGTKPSDAVNVDQLQNSGINIHSSKVEGSTGKVISAHTSPTKVKMDETVNVNAGNNIEITRNGRDIAIATSMNPQFDSVKFGKEGPKITGKAAQPAKLATATSPATPAQPAELSVNGAKITDVAPGQISATSKDAINGSQLHAMGNKLQGQINKLGNRMNAGMATSAAMANLLQPHKPGQSVATAGIGQHKDQAAVAVGYSRVSDNGKYGIRFSMGANTQGEVTSGAAVGYFW
ncbi:ESPR-type extended signal peptide-containing protein [Haemophilus haemolyticus]|uniref:ESPR-type extended signal peptide-containing protein n=1 Tax=Haemophilus haemolyticus TaxID=726 RepID=UPI0018644C2B|nr:ESPR-type extended signal peptide-containing protein [Haemophilus haemolyticus]